MKLELKFPKDTPQTKISAQLNESFEKCARIGGKYIYDFHRIKKKGNLIVYCFQFVFCKDSQKMIEFINQRTNICNRIAFDIYNDQV